MAELPDPETPQYSCNENSEPGFVRVKLKIPNLKAKSAGLIGKYIRDEKPTGKNARIESRFEERLCDIEINGDGKGSMKSNRYRYLIRQLPYPIIARHSYVEVQDGFVLVYLKKENEEQSWMTYIERDTLETAEKSELE